MTGARALTISEPALRPDRERSMLIVCPSCTTAYQIDLESLGTSARLVRCGRCQTVWPASTANAVSDPAGAAIDDSPTISPGRVQALEHVEPDDTTADAAAEVTDADWAAALVEPDGPPAEQPGPSEEAIVTHAPPLAPSIETDAGTRVGDAMPSAGADIETMAARRAPTARSARRSPRPKLSPPGLPLVIVVLVGLLVAIFNWRMAMVRMLPQTASLFAAVGLPVNLRGLSFENVKSAQEFKDAMVVLVVEGTIANVTRQVVEVPRLRFALRNGAGQEVYAWTALPTRTVLAPGDTVEFRTRLASPPSDGRDVIVRFFSRRDVIAGLN